MNNFAEFAFVRCGRAWIWLDQTLSCPALVGLLADPDRLFERADCVIVKDQRKIKVGYLSLEWEDKQTVVYVKRYNPFAWRFSIQSIFLGSGAARALRGASLLSRIGIATARPVAAIEERRHGLLLKSFYVSEAIEGGVTADTYWRETLGPWPNQQGVQERRRFLRDLGAIFARLHAGAVYHNDLKDANILVSSAMDRGSARIQLLDLEGVRQYSHLTRRRRVKNLVQLNRTLGKWVKPSYRWYFLSCYLGGANGSDRGARKRWAKEIVLRSARLDRSKQLKTDEC